MPQLRRLRLDTLLVDDAPVLALPNLQSLMVTKAKGMRPTFDDLVASTPWDV
jgi:hypothetical protein